MQRKNQAGAGGCAQLDRGTTPQKAQEKKRQAHPAGLDEKDAVNYLDNWNIVWMAVFQYLTEPKNDTTVTT